MFKIIIPIVIVLLIGTTWVYVLKHVLSMGKKDKRTK